MSLAGLLAALLLTLLALTIVAYPLLRRREATGVPTGVPHSSPRDLDTNYQRALINIRDLDEDFATGKLDARSYHEEREAWAQRGIELLRQIDERT